MEQERGKILIEPLRDISVLELSDGKVAIRFDYGPTDQPKRIVFDLPEHMIRGLVDALVEAHAGVMRSREPPPRSH